MAVQAHFYSENSGLPICLQDWSGPQVLGIDNGLLFTSLPYPPPQPQFQQDYHSFQSLGFDSSINQFQGSSSSSFSSYNANFPSIPLSQALNAQLEIQRHEIDHILLSQNEKLRHALQHQRKEQVGILLRGLESKSLSLIKQKEDDLAQARKRSLELEDCLKKAEMESEAWQRIAKEKEAMVLSLTNTLEQVRERGLWDNSNRAEDTESCCGPCDEERRENEEEDEDEEEEEGKRIRVCKSCKSRSSCVLFLPCRHLCSCYFCEALLEFCPVCKTAKEGCMEVLLAA